jgi:hypothetical protein
MSDELTRFHGHLAFITSAEVWAVLRARHAQAMTVTSSFSDPTGTFNGGPGEHGVMETTYGLDGADYPLIGARTTWRVNPEKPSERIDERHAYFLFVTMKEDER